MGRVGFLLLATAGTKLELVALIGAHIGLKPAKDLTRPVIQHFSNSSPSLLILDELETLWEPAQSRSEIEEFLSLLTGVDHLALMITMRGAERPGKTQWTRPFLPSLQPLGQEAARLTFNDIAESDRMDEVDKILCLTDNMPLAITLLAHLADSDGCANVLSRWEKEKTSLISEGFDKRSNLDLSISLSLSSPIIKSLPHSQELLCLLAMLPDGLLDVDLFQSKLPLQDILKCKAALKATALAYSDANRRLKVLMPIREYIQQHCPPGDHLVRNLLEYYKELLQVCNEYSGTQLNSSTVLRITTNFGNIQNVLQWGLKHPGSDLMDTIFCACHLIDFCQMFIHAPTHLICQMHDLLPQLSDPRLQVLIIGELLGAWHYYQIPNRDVLVSQGLDQFGYFDDTDLKCRFYIKTGMYYMASKHDLSGGADVLTKSILVATSSGNVKRQVQGLHLLGWMHLLRGEYSKAETYMHKTQRLARISGYLYQEVVTVRMEARMRLEMGDYRQSLALCIRGKHLLGLCGMAGSEADQMILSLHGEIHKLKSEYIEARSVYAQILQNLSISQDTNLRPISLLNISEINLLIGVPGNSVRKNIDLARSICVTIGREPLVMCCDATLAALYLREKDLPAAMDLFQKVLKLASEDHQIRSFCFEQLGDVSSWGANESTFCWTVIFLVHSLKYKMRLGVYTALRFFGDMFLNQMDEDTAISLFTIALEGFTYMDVHRAKADCMLRLGDISKGHSDLLKAMELWEAARALFERSSQAKQVENIDHRLASMSQGIQLQRRENLAKMAELNASSGTVKEVEDDQVDIEHCENMPEDKKGVVVAI
ncbi:hypothetical protein B0H14DRAFT_350882 [Mycena olivaceomarginata]|nr:hypothetical protein B0H14DRAFT_350882 [Mycena olivaceomarginata]